MVDIINKGTNNLLQAVKGGFLKRNQLFKGVRQIEQDLKDIKKITDDLEVAIKKGKASEVIKNLREDTEKIKDCEEKLGSCIGALLYDAHLLNQLIKKLEMDDAQLEKYNLPGIKQFKAEHEELEIKLKELLEREGGIAASGAREV